MAGVKPPMSKFATSWLLACALLAAAVPCADDAYAQGWRRASREPVGLAPDPALTPEAVVQVYAARAVSWRGYFGVHTWIAVKPAFAEEYVVYEVMGWRLRRSGTAVVRSARAPDGRWFGNAPQLLADVRGDEAALAIGQIERAVAAYPWADRYRVWPGPNSNTFTAFVLRDVPALRADLPATAIGKDYLEPAFAAAAPSGTGYQLNLFGLLGVLLAAEEGVELNFLGLTLGLDFNTLTLKAPLLGRIDTRYTVLVSLIALVAVMLLRRRRASLRAADSL